jgi:photosystem II stability/assembly factor-like uncharacterized protein
MRSRPPAIAALAALLALLWLASSSAGDGGGERAVQARLAPESLLLDVTRNDGGLVAVGERGHVLRATAEGGWVQAPVPTRAMLTGVCFADAGVGFAVGHDAVILRTRDGGEHWERVHADPELQAPLLDVWCADREHALAVGAYGLMLATDDGGESWQRRYVNDEDDWHLNRIATTPDGTLYIAAEAGHVYRSDDGGETWSGMETDYEGSYFGLLPLGDEDLLLFGLRGHLFRSDDGGASWRPIPTGTQASLDQGLRLPDGSVVIVGLAGTVLVSRDGGETFTLHQQAQRLGFAGLADAGEDLVLVGEGGVHRLPLAGLLATPQGGDP